VIPLSRYQNAPRYDKMRKNFSVALSAALVSEDFIGASSFDGNNYKARSL
jgi:hypothetical protein